MKGALMSHKTPEPPVFDPEVYRHHLKNIDISQDEADELLAALWHIMQTFVDIGWGVDNVQRIFPDLFNETSLSAQDSLEPNRGDRTFIGSGEASPLNPQAILNEPTQRTNKEGK
jgi:hypothetical protein